MTVTFHTRKACQVRRAPCADSPLRPQPAPAHPPNDCALPPTFNTTCPSPLQRCSSRRPVALYKFRQKPVKSMTFHNRKVTPNLDARCIKTLPKPHRFTVQLRDFSACVCQLQTPSPIRQGTTSSPCPLLAVSHKCDRLPYMEGMPKLRRAGTSKGLKASQMLKLKRRHSLSRA